MNFNLNLIGLTIRNKQGEIVAIAKRVCKKELFFEMIDKKDELNKEPALYSNATTAKKSFTVLVSKDYYYIDNKVAEFIENEYGIHCNKLSDGRTSRVNKYEDFKKIISFTSFNTIFEEEGDL